MQIDFNVKAVWFADAEVRMLLNKIPITQDLLDNNLWVLYTFQVGDENRINRKTRMVYFVMSDLEDLHLRRRINAIKVKDGKSTKALDFIIDDSTAANRHWQ